MKQERIFMGERNVEKCNAAQHADNCAPPYFSLWHSSEVYKLGHKASQQHVLLPIRQAVGQLTAEKVYHYLLRHQPGEEDMVRLPKLFWADEHDA